MERRYTKLVFETWCLEQDIERAIAVGEYTKTYYLDDHTIGRVDLFDRDEGLCKVSYREVPPPYEELLAEHRRTYPGAMCEFWTPAVRSPDNLWVARTSVFEPSGELGNRFEVHSDDAGRCLRRIKLGPDGEPAEEERPIYDGAGRMIGFGLYDAAGNFVREYLNDD
jgi:hypothetical protein